MVNIFSNNVNSQNSKRRCYKNAQAVVCEVRTNSQGSPPPHPRPQEASSTHGVNVIPTALFGDSTENEEM